MNRIKAAILSCWEKNDTTSRALPPDPIWLSTDIQALHQSKDHGMTSFDQEEIIKAGGIECWVGVEYVRRLNVEPEDQSTYQQKASCNELGHRAKKSRNYTKEIRVTKVAIGLTQLEVNWARIRTMLGWIEGPNNDLELRQAVALLGLTVESFDGSSSYDKTGRWYRLVSRGRKHYTLKDESSASEDEVANYALTAFNNKDYLRSGRDN
ncbi:hypothetical protein MUK42_35556 [Musa troglodytarum]|uniref:Uncharacterized protein n=1 Tax=Musa troglodytarum TaxID=320322 RepID=A0A9E7EE05_9LILI|nr:hypothetical protein MUK42_35556 [Musa troglodytarum]